MISTPSTSLKYRLLFFTIAPCVLTATLLSVIYFYSIKAIQLKAAEDKVITLMHQLQERITGLGADAQEISSILESALKDNNIRAVSYYNGAMKLIYHAGAKMYTVRSSQLVLRDQFSILNTSESLRIRLPLFFEPSQPDIKSWLEVEYSTSMIERDWYQSLSMTMLLNIVIIGVFLLCLWPMSNLVVSHLNQLSQQIDQLLKGFFNIEDTQVSTKEIQVLFDQLRELGQFFKETDDRNQQQISEATANLEQMLDRLGNQNTELDQARQAALQASQIKSQFLANISHEVRTPLNGILGYTSLLKKSDLSDDQEMNVLTIENCSLCLLSLINDLLDFSKMEADKLVLDKTEFHLHNLLDEVLSLLGLEAQQKGLELASLITPETPNTLIGDPLRLRQVLMNLINNAIKFTHQGSVHVTVSSKESQTEENGWELKFSIIDTGVGLTSQQQKRLFEAFSQADTTIARQYGGTGLGLVISKHLIEKMQGIIRLESVPNEGSTFWFTAKFGKSDNANTNLPDLPNFKVAICEPLAFTRKSILHRLHAWDMEVREFSNLFELSISDRFFDIVLYGLKGFEPSPVEQEVIRSLTAQGVNVIAMTMGGDTSHNQVLQTLGIQKFLTKPIHFTHLADAMKKMISVKQNSPVLLKQARQDSYVLAVDDNLANLRLIELLLKQNEIPAITAQSGIEALTLLKKYPVSIVLMDIQMPGMDGIETTQKIRAETNWKHLPVIALTAHALPDEKRNILTAGLDDYLSKPIDEEALLNTLDKWSRAYSSNTGLIIESTPENHPVIFDETLCLKRSNHIRDLAEDLIKGIRKELDAYLTIAESLNRDQHFEQLQNLTHRLHGSLKYSGFPELEKAIDALETALKMRDDEQTNRQLASVMQAGHSVMKLFDQQQLGSFSYILAAEEA
jgi:two-component system sensor histidine kinase BarA